jgi:hypothetical protein
MPGCPSSLEQQVRQPRTSLFPLKCDLWGAFQVGFRDFRDNGNYRTCAARDKYVGIAPESRHSGAQLECPVSAKNEISRDASAMLNPMRLCVLLAGGDIIAAGAMPIDGGQLRHRAPRLISPRTIYGLIGASHNECAK